MDYSAPETRQKAMELLKKHNRDDAHIKHALAVEAAMRHFAVRAGKDSDYWGTVGLLHDLDWEVTQADSSRHCHESAVWLEQEGYEPELIRAVMSHGWGLTTDVKPEDDAEKTLYAIDELTGFVTAVALVRPSKSLMDLEVSSVKKKLKDKAFAPGVDREVIKNGAGLMGEELDMLISETIAALRPVEAQLGLGQI